MGRRQDRQPKEVMHPGCPSDPRSHENGCGRLCATTAQIIMVLLHSFLKTWGEFLRRALALAQRRRMRGYDAVTLSAACNSPALKRACRGAWQIRQQSKSDTMSRVCGFWGLDPAYSCDFDTYDISTYNR